MRWNLTLQRKDEQQAWMCVVVVRPQDRVTQRIYQISQVRVELPYQVLRSSLRQLVVTKYQQSFYLTPNLCQRHSRPKLSPSLNYLDRRS